MKRTFTKYPSNYVRASRVKESDHTGYWKAIMRYFPEDGSMQEYTAYTTGYDRLEAEDNLRSVDLVGDEKNDEIFSLIPIDEAEYRRGLSR